ncbi:MAG: hypothetical protein WBP81_16850 [Solirubrobacteraceae bacterium]
MLDELVVHKPRAVHRLDHSAHQLVIDSDPTGQPVQAVMVRRRREVINQLTLIGDQTDIDPSATEIQPNVQHDLLLSHKTPQREQESARPTTYRDLWSVLRFGRPAARLLSARA